MCYVCSKTDCFLTAAFWKHNRGSCCCPTLSYAMLLLLLHYCVAVKLLENLLLRRCWSFLAVSCCQVHMPIVEDIPMYWQSVESYMSRVSAFCNNQYTCQCKISLSQCASSNTCSSALDHHLARFFSYGHVKFVYDTTLRVAICWHVVSTNILIRSRYLHPRNPQIYEGI